MPIQNPTVVFTAPQQVQLKNQPLNAPADNQLLVRTHCTLISIGTELTILNGNFPPGSKWETYGQYHFTAGYNNIGTVIEIGKDVSPDWQGKKVATYGPHAAYFTCRPENTRQLHREVSDTEAVFFTLAEIAMNGVRRGQVQWGESTVIYGLGLVGQLTARFCHLAGAAQVLGVDIAPSRRALMPHWPRSRTIDPLNEDLQELVKRSTHGRMADVVFEATGNPEAIPHEFDALKRQGRMVLLSSPKGPTTSFDFHDLCNSPSYTIIGAHNMSHPPIDTPYNQWTQKRHAELFFDWLADGQIQMAPLISHQAPYTDAPELYAMLLEDRSQAMGVILTWEE